MLDKVKSSSPSRKIFRLIEAGNSTPSALINDHLKVCCSPFSGGLHYFLELVPAQCTIGLIHRRKIEHTFPEQDIFAKTKGVQGLMVTFGNIAILTDQYRVIGNIEQVW